MLIDWVRFNIPPNTLGHIGDSFTGHAFSHSCVHALI